MIMGFVKFQRCRIAALMLCLGGLSTGAGGADTSADAGRAIQHRFDAEVKPLLTKYCGDCHFDGASKGNLDLEKFATLAAIQAEPVRWQHVADNVTTRAMPPAKRGTQP